MPESVLEEAPPPPREAPALVFAAAIVIAVAVFGCYANSLDGFYIFDDLKQILDQEEVAGIDWQRHLKARRPVVSFTVGLNGELASETEFGLPHTFGYHLLNVFVHILAGLSLFGLVRQTLRLPLWSMALRRRATAWGLAAALLWALHPLQTQSVSYIIQRAESLMGLFFLASLYALVRGSQARGEARWIWYGAVVLAGLLSAGSKAVAVTLPVVAVLYDRAFLAGSFRELFDRRWPVHAALAVAVFSILGLLDIPQAVLSPGATGNTVGFGNQAVTWQEYARSQPGVIAHYLRLALWPQGLCLDKAWPVADSLPRILLPGLLVVGLLAASVVAWRQRPWLGFLGLSFFVILAPTSSFIPIKDLAFEHRMYLPLAPVVIAFLGGLAWALPGPRNEAARWGVVGLIAVLLGAGTVVRNRVYLSDEAMWRDVTEKAPHNARAWSHLGNSYAARGGPTLPEKLELAIRYYQQGLEVVDRDSDVRTSLLTNLAAMHEALGRYPEALAKYREALDSDPRSPVVMMNLANTLSRMERYDEAFPIYRTAGQIQRELWELRGRKFSDLEQLATILQNLGSALHNAGRNEEAVAELRGLLELAPDHARGLEELARVTFQLARESDPPEREELLAECEHAARRAVEELPETRKDGGYFLLGNALRLQEQHAEAAANYARAIELAGGSYPPAQINRALCLIASAQPQAAIDELEALLIRHPDTHLAHYHMARARLALGEMDAARHHIEETLRLRPGFTPALQLQRRLP